MRRVVRQLALLFLAACPRGDPNVEYLCANHCRTKMQACKGKASKIESDPE